MYYSDDAWDAITEWFDGNDYDPTDEAFGSWDDETFIFADDPDRRGVDRDWNPSHRGDYGYDDAGEEDDDWFYDYYDDGFGVWIERKGPSSYAVYDDSDDDGLYESFAVFTDQDDDDVYDDYTYFGFDRVDSDQAEPQRRQARWRQKDTSGQKLSVDERVQRTKLIDVRGKRHLFALVETDQGKLPVDLGWQHDPQILSAGDRLSATGHRLKVGDKTLLVASQARSPAGDLSIDRSGNTFSGKLTSTRTVEVMGTEYLLAKLTTDEGKQLLVDMGPATDLGNVPGPREQVTVQGVPVKVDDRIVLMAKGFKHDGNPQPISRSTAAIGALRSAIERGDDG